jgi:Ca-activated chloride channel family protein
MSVLRRFTAVLTFAAVAYPAVALGQSQHRSVYASVLQRDGAPVTTLGATDFIVREDGVRREVLAAERATDPLRVAVLVDTSQAAEPYISDIRLALQRFFDAMAGKHEIALIGFGERPTVLVDYTRDPARLNDGVGRVFAQSGSGAYLLDAIVETSRPLRTREGGRSAIVTIATEGREFSYEDHTTVLAALAESNATLHSLVLTRNRARFAGRAAREREFAIGQGAELTGGRREDLLTSMGLTNRMEALAAELNNQYRIVYARPETLISPERVQVSVDKPGLTVRASRVPRSATE